MVDQESWDLRCWLQPVRHRARTATEPGGGLERCLDTKKLCEKYIEKHVGVSKNSGTPKWMVYNGNPYQNGWFGGTFIFGNTHVAFSSDLFWKFPGDKNLGRNQAESIPSTDSFFSPPDFRWLRGHPKNIPEVSCQVTPQKTEYGTNTKTPRHPETAPVTFFSRGLCS